MPLVSIGVPVFNGAALIGECLENLAGQTFRDIEVIISDNASTDGTTEICEAFARKDTRFRVIRRKNTSSAMENFLAVRREASSPLYMWRAFDDLSSSNFIETLVDLHRQLPDITLAVPAVVQLYGGRKPDRQMPYVPYKRGNRGVELVQILRRMQAGWFYGLWKLEAAGRATEGVYGYFPEAWGADYLALFYTALYGRIVGSNNCSFQQRLIDELRDYMPRPQPSYAEMVDRNRRFATTCHTLIEGTDMTAVDKAIVRTYVPFFTNRCSHRAKRVFRAAIRQFKEL